MDRLRRLKSTRDQSGVALVEFALILPFVAILAMGTIDSSGAPCADPYNVTYRALHEDPNAAGFSVTVTNTDTNTVVTGCSPTGADPGTHLKVSVQSSFTVLTPFVSALTGRTKVIHGTTEVVVQG